MPLLRLRADDSKRRRRRHPGRQGRARVHRLRRQRVVEPRSL